MKLFENIRIRKKGRIQKNTQEQNNKIISNNNKVEQKVKHQVDNFEEIYAMRPLLDNLEKDLEQLISEKKAFVKESERIEKRRAEFDKSESKSQEEEKAIKAEIAMLEEKRRVLNLKVNTFASRLSQLEETKNNFWESNIEDINEK